MHSVLEGVLKNFFKFWFESTISCNYSLKKYMQEIDNRLLNIKPPKFIPSTPRSIYSYKLWRAHEYLSFILYYSLPVFIKIMTTEYYDNLAKLVIFLEILLSPKIDLQQLKKSEVLIFNFVEELETLYPHSIMLSGVHELLHLVDCTLDFGPLNGINLFQFEEINRKLVRFIHGFDLIGEELIKLYSTAQHLITFSNKISNSNLKQFISKRLGFKSSNKKKSSHSNSVGQLICIGNSVISSNEKYLLVINEFLSLELESLKIFKKITSNGVVYTSNFHSTKRCDSYFVSKTSKKIGLIECFFVNSGICYVIAKKIIFISNPFYFCSCPELKSKSAIFYLSGDLFVEDVKNISKVVCSDTGDSNIIVSLFNSSHLFS